MKTANSLTVFEKGNPDGQPLILIHGGGGGIWAWDEVIRYLPEYHIYMPELPEHGSSRSNGPFTIKSTAEHIVEFIQETVPGKKAHVFGHSVGGQIVLEMLSRSPEVFLSAIISGAQVLPVPGDRWGIYSERSMALLYWLGIAPWKHNDRWIRWNMRSSTGIPEKFFGRFKANFQSLTRNSWAHVMSENFRYRLPSGLENVQLPVLLVAGAHEKVDIQPTNLLLARVLPNVRSIQIRSDKGWSAPQEHNWPMTAPDMCAAAIRAWVEGHPLPMDFFTEMPIESK